MKENASEDILLNKILNESKIKAGENLKFRIMRQISTEKALSIEKSSHCQIFQLKTFLSVLGIMYISMSIAALLIYLFYGKEGLSTINFSITMIAINLICSIYGLVSVLDDKRLDKLEK